MNKVLAWYNSTRWSSNMWTTEGQQRA